MIRIFRKIRHQLLSTDKYPIYFLYAAGEIVLVMVGILLALQIDNWNAERINRLEEKEYLNRIVLNLDRDLINIMASSEGHEKRLIVGIQVLDSLGSNNLDSFRDGDVYANTLKKYSANRTWIPNTMGGKFWHTLRIGIFYKSDITFQELLSTGKIDIIKNQELRTAIQQHYLRITENQNFQDRIVMTIQMNFRDALNKNNISMKNRESYSDLKDKFIDTQGLIVALENYLVVTAIALRMFTYNDNSIQKMTESLIIQIKEELDNPK